MKQKRQNYEFQIQCDFFNTINLLINKYSFLDRFFAVPNGGSRNIIEGKNLKKSGVKAGVPDILCPVKSEALNYDGLAIEFKYGVNKQTEKQLQWQICLEDANWMYCLCYSTEDAIRAVETYFNIKIYQS